jgi:poly(hydroxyalkanoate) granule-associated protein
MPGVTQCVIENEKISWLRCQVFQKSLASGSKESIMNIPNITIIEETQESIESSRERLQKLGRRATRAYLGVLGLAYDEAKARWQQGQQLLERAENRGQEMNKQAMSEARNYYEEAGSRLNSLQNRVRRNTAAMEEQMGDEIEVRIEAVLNRLNIPSREQIARLNAKIEALNRKIEEAAVAEADATTREPMPQYEQMTAKEVVSQLNELSIEELRAVKEYEMAHENRVTVLREVDGRLQAMPIARYDQLTVQEIEPLLGTLTVAELNYLAEYEAAHEERVTLLRAIETEVKSRPAA